MAARPTPRPRVAETTERSLPDSSSRDALPRGKRTDRVASLVSLARRVGKIEMRLEAVAADVRDLCEDPIARKLLEEKLQDLSRQLYAVADGSAYQSEGSAA